MCYFLGRRLNVTCVVVLWIADKIAGGKKVFLERSQTVHAARARAGRPTREQAEERHNELLDSALEAFLDKGFEQATVDAIAASVGMAKRTMYARYEDKTALFKAAVQRAIERFILPEEHLRAADTGDLEETLTALARLRVAHVLSPTGLRLQRILSTESYRFPDIFDSAFEQGTKPMIEFLSQVLQRHVDAGHAVIDDTRRAATMFLIMVLGGPTRIYTSGHTINPEELEARVHFSVRLFLKGVEVRPAVGG